MKLDEKLDGNVDTKLERLWWSAAAFYAAAAADWEKKQTHRRMYS